MWSIFCIFLIKIFSTYAESQAPTLGGIPRRNVYVVKDYYILRGDQMHPSPISSQFPNIPAVQATHFQQNGNRFSYTSGHIVKSQPTPHLVTSPLFQLLQPSLHRPTIYRINPQPDPVSQAVPFIQQFQPAVQGHGNLLRYPFQPHPSLAQVPLTTVPFTIFSQGDLVRSGDGCALEIFPNEKGTCYSSDECLATNGIPNNPCRAFSNLRCCVYRKTCGSYTKEEFTYFRNDGYPRYTQFKPDCSIEVEKRNGVCSVRANVEFIDNLTKDSRSCNIRSFQVTPVNSKVEYEPLCIERDKKYRVDFGSANTLRFEMTHHAPISTSWKISLEQEPCSGSKEQATPWPKSGEITEGDGSTSTTAGGSTATTGGSTTTAGGSTTIAGGSTTTAGGSTTTSGGSTTTTTEDSSQSSTDSATTESSGSTGTPLTNSAADATFKCGKRSFKGRINSPSLRSEEDETLTIENSIPTLEESIFYKVSKPIMDLGKRIVRGKRAEPKEFPWQVAIYRIKRAKTVFHCGGTVISERHVLTACHCVKRVPKSSLILQVGNYLTDKPGSLEGAIEPKIEEIYPHTGFTFDKLENDIALIKLVDRLEFSPSLLPPCLPIKEPEVGSISTVTGWGRDELNKLQKTLKKLQSALVPRIECNKRWLKLTVSIDLITDNMICLSTQDGDSCKGDSGGPVVQPDKDTGIVYLVGITSFGSRNCKDPYYPGVYTKVVRYVDWIRNTMKL